jgi:choline dehydrogenase-like flavoprotein
MQGCKSGAKWSTANVEIPKAEASGRCEVRAECMALAIHHDDMGRVSGVLYADKQGDQHFQKARIVCVAANSIETSRVLLNSASAKFPDGLANGSGMIGRHYMRHMTGYVYAEFERTVNMHRGNPTAGVVRDEVRDDPSRGFAGGFYIGACSLGLPFYGGFLDPSAWGGEYASWIEAYERTAGLFVQGEDLAIATNRVTLHPTEKDVFGLPIPCLHLDNHANEIAMKNYAYRKSNELYDAVGAKRVFEAPPLPVSHNLGTCRMSARPEDGVVNEWGQCHEVANLFVSDGSQFASSSAGGPTLTIVALAIRQADRIAELMSAGEL